MKLGGFALARAIAEDGNSNSVRQFCTLIC